MFNIIFFNSSEPEFKSPRVKHLYDLWRHVWMLSWERQRELHAHLAYLREKKRAENFSWDDWRKRVSRIEMSTYIHFIILYRVSYLGNHTAYISM